MKSDFLSNLLLTITGIILSTNIILMSLFPAKNSFLINLGYTILIVGLLLVFISIWTIRKKKNNKIIKKGIYSIVRHPMYLGGMIMFFSHFFIGQNLKVSILTIIGIISCYLIINIEDENSVKKFGKSYTEYQDLTPKINIIYGIFKIFR
jgi:protein-S-isoprenylcysteine O-methyltransferase Ste14